MSSAPSTTQHSFSVFPPHPATSLPVAASHTGCCCRPHPLAPRAADSGPRHTQHTASLELPSLEDHCCPWQVLPLWNPSVTYSSKLHQGEGGLGANKDTKRRQWKEKPEDRQRPSCRWENHCFSRALCAMQVRYCLSCSFLPFLHLFYSCVQQDAASFTSEATFHTSNILLEVNKFLTIHTTPVIPITWKSSTAHVQLKTPSSETLPHPFMLY